MVLSFFGFRCDGPFTIINPSRQSDRASIAFTLWRLVISAQGRVSGIERLETDMLDGPGVDDGESVTQLIPRVGGEMSGAERGMGFLHLPAEPAVILGVEMSKWLPVETKVTRQSPTRHGGEVVEVGGDVQERVIFVIGHGRFLLIHGRADVESTSA